jgi:hydrogenase maturation protease
MRALVAGVGNIFLGDDGFGVEVARRLLETPLPREVRVEDFGVRALHLAYELLEPYDMVIIVDAMSRGSAPGTLYVMEPDESGAPVPQEVPDGHGLHPSAVLRFARELGAPLGHVRIVACEPEQVDECEGLSPVVAQTVAEAVRIVHELLGSGGGKRTCGCALDAIGTSRSRP